MSSAGLGKRLRKLETQQEGEGRIIVVDGYCEQEQDAKIDELRRQGQIGLRDIVVAVARFDEPPERRPGVRYFCDAVR